MKRLTPIVLAVLLAGCQYQWVPHFGTSNTDPTRPQVTCHDGAQQVNIEIGNAWEAWNLDEYDLRLIQLRRQPAGGGSWVTVVGSPVTIGSAAEPSDPEDEGINWAGFADVHPYTSTASWSYELSWEWLDGGSVVAGPFVSAYTFTLPGCPGGLP